MGTFNGKGSMNWRSTMCSAKCRAANPFAGAMVALGNSEGEMFAFIVSPDSRVASVHPLRLEEKHMNIIRKLKLEIPAPQGEPLT